MSTTQEDKFIIEQYKECGRAASLYDNAIWQIPSATFLIIGVFVSLAYGYITSAPVRALLMALASIWILILFIVMEKHMFFVTQQKEMMVRIEVERFGIPSLQRFGHSKTTKEHLESLGLDLSKLSSDAFKWWESPKGLRTLSAHSMLRFGMISLFILMMSLTILNILNIPLLDPS